MDDAQTWAVAYLGAQGRVPWLWADDGDVLVWKDGTTVAFRQEIELVLQQLQPRGLPPFGAVVLLLGACRDGWLDNNELRNALVAFSFKISDVPSRAPVFDERGMVGLEGIILRPNRGRQSKHNYAYSKNPSSHPHSHSHFPGSDLERPEGRNILASFSISVCKAGLRSKVVSPLIAIIGPTINIRISSKNPMDYIPKYNITNDKLKQQLISTNIVTTTVDEYPQWLRKRAENLAREAIQDHGVRDVLLVHRLGRLEVGETSVLIAAASAHRAQAFAACRWLIDTLKTTVTIWKKEHFEDGAVWADGEPFPAEVKGLPGR